MVIKPGYKTSEFWFTLVSFIFSGLFLLGVIGNNDQKEELIRDVSHGVESIILIGGQLLILWNYISSRKTAKQIYIQPQPLPDTVAEEAVNDNKRKRNNNSSTNKSRTNKSRSRKTNSKNKRKS